jgi:hypothetical protein
MNVTPVYVSYTPVARDTQVEIEAAQTFNKDEEKMTPNCLERLHSRILHFSIVTRYMVYVAPLALLLAIPVILSQTKVTKGSIGGTDQQGFWIWIEIGECPRQPCIGRR